MKKLMIILSYLVILYLCTDSTQGLSLYCKIINVLMYGAFFIRNTKTNRCGHVPILGALLIEKKFRTISEIIRYIPHHFTLSRFQWLQKIDFSYIIQVVVCLPKSLSSVKIVQIK